MVEKTHPDRLLRLAALFHDVGKPKTRSYGPRGAVSFHHHEVVGARMTRDRMRALRYSTEDVEVVTRLVELHLRFHTYRMGWTDSAVRRYVRDAGPLLDRLNELTRCDCTTRNPAKAKALARRMDELDARIAELREQEELRAIRPDLDGNAVMARLGLRPGPEVGKALAFCSSCGSRKARSGRTRRAGASTPGGRGSTAAGTRTTPTPTPRSSSNFVRFCPLLAA